MRQILRADSYWRAAPLPRCWACHSCARRDNRAQWSYIQTYKPFAVDLALTGERLRYMQALNVRFKVQKEILPFERVADMSLAADALKLLSGRWITLSAECQRGGA